MIVCRLFETISVGSTPYRLFPLLNATVEHLPAHSAAVHWGTCTLAWCEKGSTGSRAGCAGIPEVISEAARRGFPRSRTVTI